MKRKYPNHLEWSIGSINNNEIVANNYLFGERYAEAFSKGIKNRTRLESLNLNSNRLTDIGFSKILQNAPQNLLILDLSYNFTLWMDSYKVIAEYLDDHTTILQQLMIEGNQTGDKPVILICKALQYNKQFKVPQY